MSRLLLRSLKRTTLPLSIRTSTRPSSTFTQSPSPPRLPADQQAEFERLQRAAEEALHTHTSIPSVSPLTTSRHSTSPTSSASPSTTAQNTSTVAAETTPPLHPEAASEGQATFSGGIRKGAPPEFEGDKNPKTGEVGGPKNEPLRWGGEGDWSYNGRVTDF